MHIFKRMDNNSARLAQFVIRYAVLKLLPFQCVITVNLADIPLHNKSIN